MTQAAFTKQRLIKRLRWYYPMELFNAVLFSGITAYVLIDLPFVETFSLVYGLAFMSFILYQGGYYWMIKLKSIEQEISISTSDAKLFRTFKRLNEYAIALALVVLLTHIVSGWLRIEILYWSILTNGFAILEYINYYHKQLMIDNSYDVQYVLRNRRLKTASLRKDLTARSLTTRE